MVRAERVSRLGEPSRRGLRRSMLINNESAPVADPRPEERELWERLYRG